MERRGLKLKSGELVLVAELFSPGPGRPLVVLCHGVPLSPPDPEDEGYPLLAGRICESGYSVLFVNFRGTGESEGDFCLGGWYSDLEAAVEYARAEAGECEGLYLAGFSAGGALAIRYAGEHGGVDGVAAFAPPARFEDIFPREHLMAFIELARDVGIIRETRFPPSPQWFYDDLLENSAIKYVGGISPAPLLIVHGEEDEVVPVEQGVELFEAAGEPKELRLLAGGAHRLRHDPRALECLIGWLERMKTGGVR